MANDRWHGRVTVTEDDIAKMYGDLRLEISGSADMAGEALDWDLATPGAQGYAYPLHMPGFVASASDEDAGVEKNTTVLSLQSMKVTIHKGYGNQTVVSGAPMTQTGRDFRYEWDTVADGDSEYDVTLKAYDGSSGQILQDMKRDIVVDFSVLMMRELKAWLSRAGGTQQIPFYHATWSRGELQVETEPAKPQQGDSLLVDIWLNEPAEVDSFDLRLVGTGPFEEYGLEMVEYDSTTYRWRGAVPFVTWDAMRNRMEGERRNRGYGRDRQGNLLDANPGTTAYRDSTGAWHDYESDSRDGEHYDTNHAFYIAPFKDVCLLVDASSSMFLPGWELSQVHAPQHIVQWMMDQADSEDWRVAAWRFWNTVEQLADYSDDLDDAWASLFSAGPVLGNLHEPGQFNPGYDFDGWMAMTDVENGLLEAMTYAMAEYDDPKVICIWSDFWHNYGRTADEVEATFQQVAEWDPLFLFGNGAAMHGCQCSEEMREAARISGGGYFEGFGATEVESLYRVIPPVIESRAFLAGVDGEGSDTLTVHVDSTLSVLNVIVPLTAWSGRGVAREQEAREGDVPRSRGTYELEDPFGSPVTPSYSATGVMQWEVESPEVGAWALEVNDLPDAEYSVVARGGSPIELKLLSMGSIAQGATDTIRVKLEWAALENEEFELVDQQGEVVAPLVLDEVDIRVYEGTYTFDEGGHYRVRIRGDLGTQTVERETELCLNVRPAPELVFTAPAPGHADAGWIEYVVRWTDTCPERNATVTIGYDDDAVGGDGPILWTGPENDDQAPDSLVWDLTTLPEGAWYVWGRIDDGLNDPVLTYGGSVQVGQGYQPGWPVTLGGSIQGHLALADLGGDGTVEVAAASTDSNLYVVRHDGTMQPGFPVNLHRAVTAGVAAGDVDDDGELELVVATTQGPGAGLVSVVNGSGSMESGWPQTAGTGTRSTPLLIDLTGDGIDDIVVASYDGWVRAWQGNGTVVGGSWPKNLGYGVQDNSPAGADIDGDGEADVVVCSREGNTSRVWALEKDGSTKWQRVLPCFSWSGIAIGDADADGKQEVVITTVGYGLTGQLPRLHVLNGEDGADSPLWAGGVPISGGSYNVWSSPALGYLEGEGFPRIVVTNADGEVRAYNSAGSTVWVKDVTGYSIRSSPLIADLGGDQDMEVVVTSPNRMYVLSGASGDTITAYCRWTNSTGIPASTGGIADLDGDGDLEIVAPTSGAVVNCWDVPGLIWEDGQEWPQFQRDAVKTGRYAEGAEPAAPEVQGIQAAAPDSLRIRWGSVDEDVYGRDEVVTTYKVYRGTTAFGVDGSVLAGEVAAQDTTFTERPGTVGNPSVHSFYRVTAEDQYGNESALSDETVGEFERNTGNTAAKPDVPGVEEHE
ncbi:MAG: VCBS repeat-containing protein [Candidatus Eisenbacteria bacterium]|nr:VCBS repeat-containing protein [Candidatus Eisenbacteria bacterium]